VTLQSITHIKVEISKKEEEEEKEEEDIAIINYVHLPIE
jgi:hypothetical protein